MNPNRTYLAAFTIGLLGVYSSSLHGQPNITSTVTPNSVTLGQTATYVVSIEGDKQPKVWLPPKVDGLEIDYSGTGQSMRISTVNRKTVRVVTKKYNYRIVPRRTGSFIIPTYALSINRRKVMIPAATFTVLPPDGRSATTLDELAFLELKREEEAIYVGQNLRYVLKLFVHTGLTEIRAGELNQKGDAFSQREMAQSTGSYGARRNNLNYQVHNLPVTVTPLKAGQQTLEFELTIQVSLPRQRRRSSSSAFDRFFNDEFFSFGGFRERRNISITTGPIEVLVQSLPEKGKPQSFSGAIGHFSIKQALSATELNAGDPLTLKVEIAGEGNFDRIQPTDLKVGEDWKTYPPKAEFIAGDKMKHQGTKIFDYVLIPQSTEITQSPPVHFSYFDPDSAQYVQLSPEPVDLTVNPATIIATSASIVPQSARSNGRGQASQRARERNILPIKLLAGRWIPSIQPAFQSPFFISSQLIPFLLLSGIYLLRRRQIRLRDDAFYARRLKTTRAMRKWLQAAKESSTEDDSSAFFAAAQRAIQESVGKHFTCRAATFTLADLEVFLADRQTEESLLNDVRDFFEAGDAIRFFAGNQAQEKTLREWNKRLLDLVAKLSTLK